MTTAAHGIHGDGHRAYTDAQFAVVVAQILQLAPGETVTVEQLSQRTGVPGRTVREIVSCADGEDILLGGDGAGYQRADTAQDAQRLTNRLQSQIQRMLQRVARRQDRTAALEESE
jgi:hypothetical protein